MEIVYKQAMAANADTRIIAPMVSRHFDFLESLVQGGKLPVPPDQMKTVLEKFDILIGSAPVGRVYITHVLHICFCCCFYC
jgi:hypothetical protein